MDIVDKKRENDSIYGNAKQYRGMPGTTARSQKNYMCHNEKLRINAIKNSVSSDLPIKNGKCIFCQDLLTDDPNCFGELLSKDGYAFHFFCLLFSSGLTQKGDSDSPEDLYGFNLPDILKEFRRAQKLKCFWCKRMGASIGCCVSSCKKSYHFPCSLKTDIHNQYWGSFGSYCSEHRPTFPIKMPHIHVTDKGHEFIKQNSITKNNDCNFEDKDYTDYELIRGNNSISPPSRIFASTTKNETRPNKEKKKNGYTQPAKSKKSIPVLNHDDFECEEIIRTECKTTTTPLLIQRHENPPDVSPQSIICLICQDTIPLFDLKEFYILQTECCSNAYFHRNCIQKQAFHSGYLFQCPACCSKEIFLGSMKDRGIYIPERDASWELEENAYSELYQKPEYCSDLYCKCPHGTNYFKQSTVWEMLICESCGSEAKHLACVGFKLTDSIPDQWYCTNCAPLYTIPPNPELSNYMHSDDIASLTKYYNGEQNVENFQENIPNTSSFDFVNHRPILPTKTLNKGLENVIKDNISISKKSKKKSLHLSKSQRLHHRANNQKNTSLNVISSITSDIDGVSINDGKDNNVHHKSELPHSSMPKTGHKSGNKQLNENQFIDLTESNSKLLPDISNKDLKDTDPCVNNAITVDTQNPLNYIVKHNESFTTTAINTQTVNTLETNATNTKFVSPVKLTLVKSIINHLWSCVTTGAHHNTNKDFRAFSLGSSKISNNDTINVKNDYDTLHRIPPVAEHAKEFDVTDEAYYNLESDKSFFSDCQSDYEIDHAKTSSKHKASVNPKKNLKSINKKGKKSKSSKKASNVKKYRKTLYSLNENYYTRSKLYRHKTKAH